MTSQSTVSLTGLPRTIEEFIALRDDVARTPEGGAAMMVLALLAHTEDRDLGSQCLVVAVDRQRLEEGADGYRNWRLRARERRLIESQLAAQPYLPRTYVVGSRPETGYAVPEGPLAIEISSNPHSGDAASGRYKVFVGCSGALRPRPVTVQRNAHGYWKAYEWSSLLSGVVAPQAPPEDDL